jgi:hypothetical protein
METRVRQCCRVCATVNAPSIRGRTTRCRLTNGLAGLPGRHDACVLSAQLHAAQSGAGVRFFQFLSCEFVLASTGSQHTCLDSVDQAARRGSPVLPRNRGLFRNERRRDADLGPFVSKSVERGRSLLRGSRALPWCIARAGSTGRRGVTPGAHEQRLGDQHRGPISSCAHSGTGAGARCAM